MKKASTTYYTIRGFEEGGESIEIQVNEDCPHLKYKPILIKMADCWRSPEDAIDYFEWVIKNIKELNP